jgi:hypothetical protein
MHGVGVVCRDNIAIATVWDDTAISGPPFIVFPRWFDICVSGRLITRRKMPFIFAHLPSRVVEAMHKRAWISGLANASANQLRVAGVSSLDGMTSGLKASAQDP